MGSVETEFVFYFVCGFIGLAYPYLLCYSATKITFEVTNIGNIAYNSKWYEYPHNERMFAISIIARSQKPVRFIGFKFVTCTLEGNLFSLRVVFQ